MIVVDLVHERVVRTIALRAGAMPQDVKLSPDGRTFYVADMASGGVWLIDAHTLAQAPLPAHGRAARTACTRAATRARLFVSNRGEGTIALLSFRTRRPVRKWRLPAAAARTWAASRPTAACCGCRGRYNAEVYAISTRTGRLLHRIPVGQGPHGLARLAAARPLLDRPHRHPARAGGAAVPGRTQGLSTRRGRRCQRLARGVAAELLAGERPGRALGARRVTGRCGVRIRFGASHSGWSAGSGSGSTTSRTARRRSARARRGARRCRSSRRARR